MQIPILIEPIEGGRYRARAGEPFALAAEGATRDEAYQLLDGQIAERLRSGVEVRTVSLANGTHNRTLPCDPQEGETDDEWFWRMMREGIEEYRRKDDEQLRRQDEEDAAGS